MRSAYVRAEAMVKRCLGNSHKVWNQMARWSQMSAPRQSAYAMAKSPPRRSASMSDAPLGGESAHRVLFPRTSYQPLHGSPLLGASPLQL